MKKRENTTKNSVCCLGPLKGFSTRVKTSFAHVIVSLILAAYKHLIMESFWCLRWFYVSTIHRVWRGFKSLIFMDTLTWPAVSPFHNCLLTVLAYHAFNLFQINPFIDKLMLISKGLILFVRLCGMISNLQLSFRLPTAIFFNNAEIQ